MSLSLNICRICSETYFQTTLKKRLKWCEECVKMYFEMKKELRKSRIAGDVFSKVSLDYTPALFTVTFD